MKRGRRPLLEWIITCCSYKLRFMALLLAFPAVAYLLLIISSQHLPNTRSPYDHDLPSTTLAFPRFSCLSRRHQRNFSLQPSPYLLSKLRRYENLHHRCGPLSESFRQMMSTTNDDDDDNNNNKYCKYIVYTPSRGLGNRMLGLASTFLYALLTDRVLLVDFVPNMEHLFCEPFPNSTWFLPESFPLRNTFHFRDVYSYGNLLRNKEQETSNSAPSLVRLFLHDTYDDYDKLFFKDEKQEFLEGVPWLVLISTQYFVPCIFHMHTFRAQLEKWFPGDQVENVFHHLGNYLFNPSNQAWDLITDFYESNLAKAEEIIVMQIRVFEPKKTPTSLVMKRFLACTHTNKILPDHRLELEEIRNQSSSSSKAILVASLSRKFYEEMKSIYGNEEEKFGVYQASHEEKEHHGYGNASHSMRAWVDMYLLSMSHVLVTSRFSTFGYVAAGLGGISPWIVMVPRYVNEAGLPEPSCKRAVNMEPCFLRPPGFAYPDQTAGFVGPHTVARCEHAPWRGLKLVRSGRRLLWRRKPFRSKINVDLILRMPRSNMLRDRDPKLL